MNTESDPSYEITWLVRRLFRGLAALADSYLADSGLTAADRAVLEFLYPEHQRTVPEMAHLYNVSRQHIQMTVNRLLEAALIESHPNPRHKRSARYALSDLGRDTFAEIRRNEARLIERLFDGLPDTEVAITRDTLATLNERID